jgi:hypothetical protein
LPALGSLCSPLAFDDEATVAAALECPSSKGCDAISKRFHSLCDVELPQTGVVEPNLQTCAKVLDPYAFFVDKDPDSSCIPADSVHISCRVSSSGR